MKKQIIQETMYYNFPYHFIPEIDNGFKRFKHYKVGNWYIEYMSFLKFLINYLHNKQFNSLLDIGCGDGRYTYEIYKKFPNKQIKGIDISKKAISFAKNITNLDIFYNQSIEECKKQFDILLLIEVLEHIPLKERKNFLNSIHKIMHKNSLLIVTVPHKNRKMDPRHYEHFTLSSLQDTMDQFRLIEYKFLAYKHPIVNFIYKILENNFFILKHQKTLDFLFNLYYKKFLIAPKENKALRIFASFKKI